MIDSRSELNEAYNRVVARYYDAVYGGSRELEANREFYVGLASRARGAVLELGCGTGRILLELVRRAIPCVGLDSSRTMLDVLRAKAVENTPELVCAQMQDFDLGARRFSLVCAPFRGFQHLYSRDDQRACLNRVLAHLDRGGCFAFDVAPAFDEDRAPLEEPERLDSTFELDDARVARYVSKRRDRARRVTIVTMRFRVEPLGGAPAWSEQEVINMRWFTPAELEDLLGEAGFIEVSVSGDFGASEVARARSALVITGRRP